MAFVVIMLLLFGLLLVFSGVENTSIVDYANKFIGGK